MRILGDKQPSKLMLLLGIVQALAIMEARDSAAFRIAPAPALFSQFNLKIVCALAKSETLIPLQSMFIV